MKSLSFLSDFNIEPLIRILKNSQIDEDMQTGAVQNLLVFLGHSKSNKMFVL